MKLKVKAALLSGIVLPGLGQWIVGRKKAAILAAVGVLGLLLGLAVKIVFISYEFVQINFVLNTDRAMTMDDVHREVYGTWWLILPLLAIWIWSIVDSYLGGDKIEKNRPQVPD